MRIVGVDIGSVTAPSKFAWATVDSPGQATSAFGDDPEGAVQAHALSLASNDHVVLAIEAPMAIPVPEPTSDDWRWLGRTRTGEGNRPWSAGAGAGALATGVAQTAWMLSRLHALAPDTTVTTQSQSFQAGGFQLLLVEAFVSATGKPIQAAATSQHAADAEAAAHATLAYLTNGPEGFPEVTCAPRRAINLLALLATWTGLPVPLEEMCQDALVIRTQPSV